MLNTKFTFVSYPDFLKISLQGIKRSNSNFTHQLIMDSLELIPLLLIHGYDTNGFEKFVLAQRHFPAIFQMSWGYLNQTSETHTMPFLAIVSHENKAMIVCEFCQFWIWPLNTLEAVAEAMIAWSQWNFQDLWVRYKSKFGI